nr:lipoprotein [Paenisporosarcina indica]
MKKSVIIIILIMFTLAGCGLETRTLSQFYEKDLD